MSATQVRTVDAGPRTVSRAVEVDAAADELFAMVADPRRHTELDGSGTVRDAAVASPHRLSRGTKFSVAMRMYGVPYTITSTVTEYAEDRVVEWRHPAGHRWRWELEPLSETRTTVTETFDYSPLPGIQAKALELLGLPRQNATGITRTLEGLAARHAG